MDVNNIITKIIFDGKETFIITKDKAVIQRLSLDLQGKPSSNGSMAFDLSNYNLLLITEHRESLQGLYFQMNIKQPIEKKSEPKISKAPEVVKQIQKAVNVLEKNNVKVTPNMPRRAPQKPNTATKTESLHYKPKEAQEVVSRFKKGKPQISEDDLWNED